ncbi:MAG: YceI family protein [Fimbriimonas sp.]
MKFKSALIPVTLALGFVSVIAFHPGRAYAEPRIAQGKAAPMIVSGTYNVDPMHSGVYFEIVHMGLARVTGRFNKFSGKIVEDAKDLGKSSVEFTAQVDSVDTMIPARDTHLKNADFFEVEKYPTLKFKSTKVAKTKEGYVVTGDLTIKDKTKSISIPFKHYGPLKHEMMGTVVGIVAEPIVIKRSDFGVGSTTPLPDGTMGASDEVTIRISLEAGLAK